MTSNFYSGIQRNLLAYPEKVFIKWPVDSKNKEYTGAELLEGISLFGQSLAKHKIEPGEKVLIAIPFSYKMVCALLGVMAIGAIPVLPPAASTKQDLIRLIRQQKITAIALQDPSLSQKILFRILRVKIISAVSAQKYFVPEPQFVPEDQAALISFSSGTTGRPKAVLRTHKILQAQHQALRQSFPTSPDQQDFPLFPNVLLHNLSLGITTIIPNIPRFDLQQLEPSKIIEQLLKEEIDSLTGNVYYFKKLKSYLAEKNILLPGVRDLGIGGSPVPEFLAHQLKKHFVNANIHIIYGSTQAEPIAVRNISGDPKDPSLGFCIGKVHPDLELRIKAGNKILDPDTPFNSGSIEVKGAHVVSENEWLVTGDFGYLNEEGELYLTGRAGNEKSIQGISHYQLEHVLLHIPGVEHAAAIVEGAGFKIIFQGKAASKELEILLKTKFPTIVISAIQQIDKMPLDNRHHSKILYKDLCIQNSKT